jgi:redox-sensitive bicupin YhaK (pirin superfamily)
MQMLHSAVLVKERKKMKFELFKNDSRGHKNHGWLDTFHTFSFASYFNPKRINFGALRVLNDDTVIGGEGFGTHPHDNMEIVSIPLSGDLEHKDSMGNGSVIKHGEVQVMSAGTGITHSEYNANDDRPVKFFQIWVFPNKENVTPRYDQKKFDFTANRNKLVQLVSPYSDDEKGGLWIHQDAWFNMGEFDEGKSVEYTLNKKGNGLFAMVVEGEFNVNGHLLSRRDAVGLWELGDEEKIKITADSDNAKILLIEVPMYKVVL